MDQGEIKKQAKKIIDNFASALESVKVEGEEFVEREEDRRKETPEEEKTDSEFRKIILKNAPKTKDDCILAEKGKWTK